MTVSTSRSSGSLTQEHDGMEQPFPLSIMTLRIDTCQALCDNAGGRVSILYWRCLCHTVHGMRLLTA